MARILVAEDDPVLRYILARGLRNEGHDVVEAASADETTAVLASFAVVDLVITDVQMPGTMDGFVLARRIRADHPALPVIVVSAWDGSVNIQELGLSAFFRKPYNVEKICAHIATLTLDRNTATQKRRQAGDE